MLRLCLHVLFGVLLTLLTPWSATAAVSTQRLHPSQTPFALAGPPSPCRTQEAPAQASLTRHQPHPGASEYGFGGGCPPAAGDRNDTWCCTDSSAKPARMAQGGGNKTAGNLYDPVGRDYKPTNQITRRGNTRYFWTADGQLGEKETQTPLGREHTYYRWNHNGLLDEVTLPDGRQLTFHYDSFARRVLKRVLGPSRLGQSPLLKETRFFWDGQRLVHEITRNLATMTPEGPQPLVTYPESTPSDPDPAPQLLPAELRTYCHEDGSYALLAGRLPDGTWAYYVNDGIGTPEALVSEDGSPLGELERRAWQMKDPRGLTPFRFPGQYEDEETGLCYNRYRYYDPETGRFVSADPVGLRGGENAFNYAPSTLTWKDPLGLTGEGARACHVFWSGGDPAMTAAQQWAKDNNAHLR